MPTRIHFAAADDSITVSEEPTEVLTQFNAAGGSPFQLTMKGRKLGPVIVNPANITYWNEVKERSGAASFS